jgi:uncharacterized protein (DUF2141 family)
MSKSVNARFLLYSILVIFISACAKVSAPSGGLRDRLPPVPMSSVPENGSVNFKGKKFSVLFNEYVVLDNINDKFMVSPPIKKKPRIFIRGKSVNVEFDEVLKDSTTYTFYFENGIKDLNEGNILEGFKYVISTGPAIDTLSVTGYVYKSIDLEVPEKTQVLMYKDLADSVVKKHLPDYISRVDPYGYFRFDNVRPGTYRLYALKDEDNSKNYNNPQEEFAFLNSPVIITPEKNFIPIVKDTISLAKDERKTSGTKSVKKGQGKASANLTSKKEGEKKPESKTMKKGTGKGTSKKDSKKGEEKAPEPKLLDAEYRLFLFTALKKNHYLAGSSRDLKYRLNYAFSLPPDSMKVEFSIPGAADSSYFIEESKNKDTLRVWLTDSTLFSQQQISSIIKYPFTDTLGVLGYKEDTISMRYLAPRAPRSAKVKKPVYAVETNIKGGFLKLGQKISFTSKTPLKEPDTSKIKVYELIDKDKKIVPYQLTKDSITSCKYHLTASFLQGKKYLLITDSASFHGIYNECSDSTGTKFSIRDNDSFCKITLNITNYEGDRIIQLLNKKEIIISEAIMKKNGKVEFPLLESGSYRIRVIYDLNGDGKWTTGDFDSGRQPEPVSYYPGEIELKAGYEAEQDWDIGKQNFKEQKLREIKKK